MKLKYKKILILLFLLNVGVVQAIDFVKIGNRAGMNELTMPGDGDCLFWAIAAGENAAEHRRLDYGLPARKNDLRQKVAMMLKSGVFADELTLMLASDDSPYHTRDDYINAINNGMWGGDLEFLVLSKLLNKNITNHNYTGVVLTYPDNKPYRKTIHVWYTGSHYNLLLPTAKFS